jgi:hypothetical protein
MGLTMIALTHHEHRSEAMDALIDARTALANRLPEDQAPPPLPAYVPSDEIKNLTIAYTLIKGFIADEKTRHEKLDLLGMTTGILTPSVTSIPDYTKARESLDRTRYAMTD